MYSNMKTIILLVLVTIARATPFAQQQQQNEFSMDMTQSMIRGGNVGMEEFDNHGRQLFSTGSWSWSNLLCKYWKALFHLQCIVDTFDLTLNIVWY